MTMLNRTAASEWASLDGMRQTMLSRLRRMSELTVPSVLTDEFYDTETDELSNGSSSLGAQAATHLTNKLMLAMFRPSVPFFRLDMDPQVKAALMEQTGISDGDLTDALAGAERTGMRYLEQSGSRPALFEGLLHLSVLGNVLMDLTGDSVNFIGIDKYCVRRNPRGEMVTLIIRKKYRLCDLDDEARAVYSRHYNETAWDQKVNVYRWIRRVGKLYRSDVWVDDVKLPEAFSERWKIDDCPYHALTWRLPVDQDYGVGRAEDYAQDLEQHDVVSQAASEASCLAAQFRWAVNPASMTRPEDISTSGNGDAIPGSPGDIALVFANIGQQISTILAVQQEYAKRIGQGFLLNSAMIRDAERVTAEEIRMLAQELESSLGGTYSHLAQTMQQPISTWSLRKGKVTIKGNQIKPVIVTGLDALSRSSERERTMLFLNDMAILDNLSPDTKMQLNMTNIIAELAAGNGVDRTKFVATPDEVAQRQQAAQEQQLAEAQAQQTIETNGKVREDQAKADAQGNPQ